MVAGWRLVMTYLWAEGGIFFDKTEVNQPRICVIRLTNFKRFQACQYGAFRYSDKR